MRRQAMDHGCSIQRLNQPISGLYWSKTKTPIEWRWIRSDLQKDDAIRLNKKNYVMDEGTAGRRLAQFNLVENC